MSAGTLSHTFSAQEFIDLEMDAYRNNVIRVSVYSQELALQEYAIPQDSHASYDLYGISIVCLGRI